MEENKSVVSNMENTSQYKFKKSDMIIHVGSARYSSNDLTEKTVNVLRNLIPDFDKLLKNVKKQNGGSSKESNSKELENKE